jgi:phenylalanyl-tRNA synthetase beta subunit
MDFEALQNAKIRIKIYKEFSRLPSSKRDQSFLVSKESEMAQILKKL